MSLQPASIATGSTWAWSEALIILCWATAQNLRDRQERMAFAQARAARLERDRAEEAGRAVTAERLRIARELHDVVAHSMSVIAVQSGVGGHVMDAQPEEARKALAAIEATSRAALTEMRRLLGVLRADGEPQGALAPAPGLADISSLLSQVTDAGLKVWVQVTGDRRPLPAGVDVSAYRIIQEALTNVLKHASSSPATVTISYTADAVTVEVTDEGPARPAGATAVASPAPGTGSSGCGSGSRYSAASLRRGHGRKAASWCAPGSRSRRCRDDPRRRRRRSGTGARRVPGPRGLRAGS